MSIPKSIFKIHCCQSFEGLNVNLQKCGTIIPMNKIGPKKAVTEAESREDARIIISFK